MVSDEAELDEEAEGKPVDWEKIFLKFLEDQKDPIGSALREYGKGGLRRGRALYAIIAFMAGIVAGTGYLTFLGTLAGEAFTFLVGIILMYLFNLLGLRFQVS